MNPLSEYKALQMFYYYLNNSNNNCKAPCHECICKQKPAQFDSYETYLTFQKGQKFDSYYTKKAKKIGCPICRS